ncbi:MAG TPA: polyprenyl diphosphate synthase [Methylomirabilota bacterium]|nr:polyprenyl diphosphate synthase [Methylomirabilota bacterium]
MTQSSFGNSPAAPPRHVAIIMDGNGRWAQARGLPRTAGHRRGAAAVRRVVRAAPRLGITTLTLFAFSSANWKRPAAEVRALLGLFRVFLRTEVHRLLAHGVRLSVLGRRDRFPASLVRAVAAAERATRRGRRLHLRLAIDYSSREAILGAARRRGGAAASPPAFSRAIGRATGGGPAPDVDQLIRTGGERRLSDFLLWESAWAELYFTGLMWPDFTGADLAAAVADFGRRQRTFGALPAGATHPAVTGRTAS